MRYLNKQVIDHIIQMFQNCTLILFRSASSALLYALYIFIFEIGDKYLLKEFSPPTRPTPSSKYLLF